MGESGRPCGEAEGKVSHARLGSGYEAEKQIQTTTSSRASRSFVVSGKRRREKIIFFDCVIVGDRNDSQRT